LYLACSLSGIGWGLCDDQRIAHLFPKGETEWSPEVVATHQSTAAPSTTLAADADANALPDSPDPIALNASSAATAEIYTRFLLYSAQPEEMLVFKSIGRMRPGEFDFDPRMYQYGGLFIYSIAAALKAGMITGVVDDASQAPSSLAYYLNNPQAFARFYLVGRGVVVMWGLVGLFGMWAVGRHLGGARAGLLAALLFAVMPVAIALSHEAKPHLPGAVMMLWATLWGLRYVESNLPRHRQWMALCCGAALSLVLSTAWIVVVLFVVEWLVPGDTKRRLKAVGQSIGIASAAYALANPYILWNALFHRDVLMANYGQSRVMYAAGPLWDGLTNTADKLAEGSSWVVVILGVVMLAALCRRHFRTVAVLSIPATGLIIQLAFLGADKPGEYGRFALFPNMILVIAVVVGANRFLMTRWIHATWMSLALATCMAWPALDYLERFMPAQNDGRTVIGGYLNGLIDNQTTPLRVGTMRDPSPYAFPAVDFSRVEVFRVPDGASVAPQKLVVTSQWPEYLVVPINGTEGVNVHDVLAPPSAYQVVDLPGSTCDDHAGITWAGKPVVLLKRVDRP
jgi:hypothetical protein